jgi:serine/threonine protein kinase
MSIRKPEEVKFRSKDEERAAEALKDDVVGEQAAGADEKTKKRDNSAGAEKVAVNMESFEILGMMGSGSYGKVFLAQKKNTGKYYALKAISKQKIMADKKQHEIFRER